ncbi:hypothetical protein BHE74_00020875 [Ensete ventricosum]|nr:hypothetical protein GW17_00020616 [Ensete ventricosum]RWW71386.1 hypothetical protein BHE74_00020875 [Ensete ventricosum]RZS10515.1 hypothetical protein BHM03_00041750 [Ensete ventricosum]
MFPYIVCRYARYGLIFDTKNPSKEVTKELMKQGAMMTVLSTLVTAVSWPTTFLSATKFIDSKWSIAIDRCNFHMQHKSNKAGKLLAEALLKGLQGNRYVTKKSC